MNLMELVRPSRRFAIISLISVLCGAFVAEYYIGLFSTVAAYLLEHNRYHAFFGIGVILSIAALFSYDRTRINYRLVGSGLLLHFALALFVLKTAVGIFIFSVIADLITNLYTAADSGIKFVFGPLSNEFVFAIRVLPTIIFFGAIMSLLFYTGIIQRLVAVIARLLRPLMATSGAETLCAVANSFLGQTEAPLLIKNYISGMTRSEFMVVMVTGMGSISGSILAIFAGMGVPAKHLLAASVMSIPASLLIAKILYPETETPKTSHGAQVDCQSTSTNAIDAISSGTIDGLHLALNVGAMLISFISLIFVINLLLAFGATHLNSLFAYMNWSIVLPEITLAKILGVICYPFGWLLGFTGSEAFSVAQLIGTKVAVNELFAYADMLKLDLSTRTAAIVTYALCGFSNLSCIGIQIGGIGAIAPEKRAWLSEFGLRAVLGGALSNLLSAMVACLLL